MQKLAHQLRKEDNGFTLVELIVVLVILAILAAILVPTLTGYIKQANEQKYYSTAETVREAAQAVAISQFANNHKGNYPGSSEYGIDVNDRTANGQTVFDLAGVTKGDGPDKVHGLYFNLDGQGQITGGLVEFRGSDYWYRYWLENKNGKMTWRVEDYTWNLKNI